MTHSGKYTDSRRPAVVGQWSVVVLVGAWALALYIHIWRLPFFRDDMVMLLWLRDMPWGRLWIDATGFPYYRPLSFATLKLSELFFGYYQPQFLHAVNLFFHTANSIMIALLTRTIFNERGGALAGLSAGLLYAAYPFTFEVMPTTGPIFQLQAAFFTLAATLAYVRWRRSTFDIQRLTFNHWLYLSWTMALLGSFTCEYSVIIPPMIIAAEIVLRRQYKRQEAKHPVTPSPCRLVTLSYFAFTALYLILWSLVPKTRSTLPWLWLHDLGYKTLYYLQGLTWPLQPLALPLARMLGLGPLSEGAALSGEWTWPSVTLLAVIAMVGWLVLFARRRRLDPLIFGLAWWGIAVAPMWPTLNWDYTWNGPRLHYIPALGAALIWGSMIGLLPHGDATAPADSRNKAIRASASKLFSALLVLAIALISNVIFLRAQADAVLTGGQIVNDIVEAVTPMPPAESALIVNFPSWISPARRLYAIGAEGITFLPGYSTMADLIEINSRQKRAVTSVTFTNVWKPWKHTQRFYTPPLNWEDLLPALRAASRVFQIEYSPGGLQLREAGNIQPHAALTPALASFEGGISLTKATSARTAQQLTLALDWVAQQPIQADWTIYLHVYNAQDELVAQGDGDPLLGLYPLWTWQAGDSIRDIRYIALPPDLPRGHYSVYVGIFDRVSGARVLVADPAAPRHDGVLLLEFEK